MRIKQGTRSGERGEREFIEVGVVVRAHGVRGEVIVQLHNPDTKVLRHGTSLRARLRDGSVREVNAEQRSRKGRESTLRLDGVTTRDEAEQWRGARLSLPRSALRVDPEEILYADLIGCRVTQRGCDLGTVHQVFCAGASDVLVVRRGAEERMIPLVSQWVDSVDLEAGCIILSDEGEWPLSQSSGEKVPASSPEGEGTDR